MLTHTCKLCYSSQWSPIFSSQNCLVKLLLGRSSHHDFRSYYTSGKAFVKEYILCKGFGILSAAVVLCTGLVFEEIHRLSKTLKILPDESDIERSQTTRNFKITDLNEIQSVLLSMVTLARTETADLSKLQSFDHCLSQSFVNAEDELLKLIKAFPVKTVSKCTKYFMDVNLKRNIKSLSVFQKEAVWTFDGNELLLPELRREPASNKNLLNLLRAVLGHCQIDKNCTELVRQKGLQILRQIYEGHIREKPLVYEIGRILSIVTPHRWLHQEILKSGWVSLFAQWMRSSDMVLSLLATKSLANMDINNMGNSFYGDGVYLYHPQYADSEPVLADVVLIHGLLGGPFKTWRQQDEKKNSPKVDNSEDTNHQKQYNADVSNDNKIVKPRLSDKEIDFVDPLYTFCWPKDWLAVDCPNLRLLTVEYDTRLSNWSASCPYESERKTIDVLGRELLNKLEQAGVGSRPIIWIGHSMGGLLIKEMLRIANDVPALRTIVKQTKGIVFYSVPHKGSSLAGIGRRISYLVYPSIEVRQLAPGSQKLRSLHSSFKELMFDEGIPLLSFAEGQSTCLPFSLQAKIVPEDSSDPGFGEFYVMTQLNHLNICKPESSNAELYQLTLAFVVDCLSQIIRH